MNTKNHIPPNTAKGHLIRWLQFGLNWCEIDPDTGRERPDPLPCIITKAGIETKGQAFIAEHCHTIHQPSILTRRWQEMLQEGYLRDYGLRADVIAETKGPRRRWHVRRLPDLADRLGPLPKRTSLPYKDD